MEREFRRLVPGAKTAVLLLHGIVGSPEHFTKAIDLQGVIPDRISYHNVRYPGHGGSVLDFGRSSMQQWKNHAKKTFQALCQTHEEVIIVAHSMGCLFAIELAQERPDKVGFLYLLQCPLYVGLRWFGVKNLIKLPFGLISEKDPYGSAMLLACGVGTSRNIFLYASWIPRLLELFSKMAETRGRLAGICVPCYAIQCRKDELVSNRSAALLKSFGRVEVTELLHSSHFYYTPADTEQIRKKLSDLLKNPSLR